MLGVLLPIALGVTLILFFLTKDRKWLRIFGQILRVGIVIFLIFIGIYFLGRFLLVL
jgi:hypothetical protein